MKKKYKVSGFVKWERQLFSDECNFTPDESMFFDYRNEELSFEEIAEKMGYSMSKITDLSEAVSNKIIKVLPLKDAYFQKYCEKYGQ